MHESVQREDDTARVHSCVGDLAEGTTPIDFSDTESLSYHKRCWRFIHVADLRCDGRHAFVRLLNR